MNKQIIRCGVTLALASVVACSSGAGSEGASSSASITTVTADAGPLPVLTVVDAAADADDPNRPFDPVRDWPADVLMPQDTCATDADTDFVNWDREEGELESFVAAAPLTPTPYVGNTGFTFFAAKINRPDPKQQLGNCACKSGTVLGNFEKKGADPKAEHALDVCKALRKPAEICSKPVKPGDKNVPGDIHWVDGETYGWDNVMKSNCYWLAAKLCGGDVCLQTPPAESREGSVYQGELGTIKKWCPDVKDQIGAAQSGSTITGCCPAAAQVTAVCNNNKPWNQDGQPL